MVLSLGPIVATVPSSRLLLFTGFGAAGLVSQWIGDLREPPPAHGSRTLRRLFIAIHLILAPLLLPCASLASAAFARSVAPLPSEAHTEGRTVVLMNVPSVMTALPWMALDPRDEGPHVRVLAGTLGRVVITREGARTLLVELEPGAKSDPGALLYRDERHPLREGEVYEVPGMRAEVVRLDGAGTPASIRYRFDRDLDDPSFRWVAWSGRFTERAPPAIGAHVLLGSRR